MVTDARHRRLAVAVVVVVGVAVIQQLACTPIGGHRTADDAPGAEAGEPDAAEIDAAAPLFTFRTEAAPLSIGALVPDVELRDADGGAFRLTDLRGRTLVVTFFESRSPDPGLCPALLERLVEVRRDLRGDVAEQIVLAAVTVDPLFDTGERLRGLAQKLGADRPGWRLVRGDPEATARFAAAFGVVMWQRADGSIGHTLDTVVIDARGRLADRFPGTDGWSSADLLAAATAVARSSGR